jgi:hypothetical protein
MTSSQHIAKDIARSFHTPPVFSMQQYNANPTNQASVNEGFQPVQISLSPDVSRKGLTYWEGPHLETRSPI